MLRIAIIGLGWAGTRHVEAIRELDQKLDVIALMDTDSTHLAERANHFGVTKTYTDFDDVLTDPTIDAVSICTPHALHCPMAIAAAEAGKQVLVEKPMALTVDEATRMIDAAAAYGVNLYVAEQAPYTAQSAFLRSVVQNQTPIGKLTAASVRAGFRSPDFGYAGRRAWLTTLEEGGTGTWMLQGIHTVAQMRYVFGEFTTVYMQEHKAISFNRADLEGTMHGLLTMMDGTAVSIIQTCETKIATELNGYILHGEEGSILAGRDGYRLFNAESVDEMPPLQSYPDATFSAYVLEMEAFADYVNGEAIGPTTGESERRSLAIVQAGIESVASGKPIDLSVRFGEI